ncbi:hypothetical protein XA68_11525 [Ophiocordyceps unilateralis]|uniref:Uncharacterized protein n=1 Tax=Ophiocordyceps unilateralis TaxID=268505 RepID=A0A2A9PG90_OPHUN|nr:hypothetical protein XA68_11525 [Ophiocordyceps unilateralis]
MSAQTATTRTTVKYWPKLEGPCNWHAWQDMVRASAKRLCLTGHLSGTRLPPTDQRQDLLVWESNQRRMKAVLLESLTDPVLDRLLETDWNKKHTAHATFTAIKRVVKKVSEEEIREATREFFGIKAHKYADLPTFIRRLELLWNFISCVIEGLPESHFVETAITAIAKTHPVDHRRLREMWEGGNKQTLEKDAIIRYLWILTFKGPR